MKRLGLKRVLSIVTILISGSCGVRAFKEESLDCPGHSFPIWPPHDELDCKPPPEERSWPPNDYLDIGALGFYKFYKFGTDWHTAFKVCQDDGAHLVIVNSEKESTLLKHLFQENRDTLGADGIDHMWIGIHERGEHGKYYSIFGDKVEDLGYTIPWGPSQPNDVALEDCASFINTGVLFDDGCAKKYPFVCEIERSASLVKKENPSLHSVPSTLCNGQSCPGIDGLARSMYWTDLNSPNTLNWSMRKFLVDCDGDPAERVWPPYDYELVPSVGSYYKVHLFGTNWFTAAAACEEEGAHLLVVNSPAEAEAVNALVKKYPAVLGSANAGHVWTGVHERGVHGEFFTPLGESLASQGFMVWSKTPQQPNDAGLDDCVSYHASTTLYDDAWALLYHFVCEIDVRTVVGLRNSSSVSYIPSPVCNERTCEHRPGHDEVRHGQVTPQKPIIDVRGAAKLVPKKAKLVVSKKPVAVSKSSSKAGSQKQSDAGYDSSTEHETRIKSLVLKTNYTRPDLRCQHIPLDFNGAFCQSSCCSAQSVSCDGKADSAVWHSLLDDVKAIKDQLAGSNQGKLVFPGGTARATPKPKLKPQQA